MQSKYRDMLLFSFCVSTDRVSIPQRGKGFSCAGKSVSRKGIDNVPSMQCAVPSSRLNLELLGLLRVM
jgi:hypothetical protein